MARLGSWIESHPEGIYVRPADAWIDPSQPKTRAMVTHGHSDHARGGHEKVLATPETLAIMATRYGPQLGGQAIAYGESIRVGEVDVSFVPAGHVLGSAQIVLEHLAEKLQRLALGAVAQVVVVGERARQDHRLLIGSDLVGA